MPPALLSPRERLVWLAGFVLIAGLLVTTKFTSHDADSVRYATISARLSSLPVSRWVAPEWWGLSPDNPLTGYFLEHPAGLFLIPAALGRVGVPAEQAPYIFGVGAGLMALVLLATLVARLTTRQTGRAALVLLQLMPVAFVFRVRDNHEYPMLVCLLTSLIGLEGVTRSWVWTTLVILGFAGGLLVKGVFVAFVVMAAALWIVVNPTSGSRSRQIAACIAAIAATAVTAYAYDVWYTRATGGPFWSAYWDRQLGPMEVASPFSEAWAFIQHVGFYLLRLLIHSAPWSLALVWVAWRARLAAPARASERGGLWFVAGFTALSIVLLSLAGRFAERYAFSTSYLVGAAGAVAAFESWPSVARLLARLEARVPAFPAVVWIALVGLRLVLGPWLPRF